MFISVYNHITCMRYQMNTATAVVGTGGGGQLC